MKRLYTYWIVPIILGVTLSTGTMFSNVEALNAPGDISPQDWPYQSLMALDKHGHIPDKHGLTLGMNSYSVEELIPLIAEVVDRRDQMNLNDREAAVRLYDTFRRPLMNYNVALDKAEKAQKEAKQKAKKEAKKEIQTSIPLVKPLEDADNQKGYTLKNVSMDSGLPIGFKRNGDHMQASDVNRESPVSEKVEQKALTQEEIQRKMKNFTVDTRALKISGDSRISYNHKDGDVKTTNRTRVQVEMGA